MPVAAGTDAQAKSPQRLEWAYEGAATAQGTLYGTCDAFALPLAFVEPPAVQYGDHALQLDVVDTWINRTTILDALGTPVSHEINVDTQRSTRELDPNTTQLVWTDTAGPTMYPANAFETSPEPFVLEFSAAQLWSESVRNDQELGHGAAPNHHANKPLVAPTLHTWNRRVDLAQGQVHYNGPATLYLHGTQLLTDQDQEAFSATATSDDWTAPGLHIQRLHFHEAVLYAPTLEFDADFTNAQAYCGAARIQIDGAWSSHRSVADIAGNLGTDQASRTLSVGGSFVLTENLSGPSPDGQGPAVQAVAQGRFDALTVDHSPGSGWLTQWDDAARAGAVAASAGLLLPLVMSLYTRMRRAQLLRHPERRRVYDLIEQGTGITFQDIADTLNDSAPGTIRYHLSALIKRGYVRVVNVGGRHHYVKRGVDSRAHRRLLGQHDAKVRFVLSCVASRPTPLSELLDRLEREWNMSRSGAWKVLARAQSANLIDKRTDDDGVLVVSEVA